MIFELNADFWMILLILTMMTLVIVGLGNHAPVISVNERAGQATNHLAFFLGNSPCESGKTFLRFFQ